MPLFHARSGLSKMDQGLTSNIPDSASRHSFGDALLGHTPCYYIASTLSRGGVDLEKAGANKMGNSGST
jgi:hypothetical protein